MTRSRRLAEGVVRLAAQRPWWTVLALLAVAGASIGASVRAMEGDPRRLFDNRVEIWFLDEDPALTAYREFQRTFGNDEAVLIALAAPEGEEVFTPETLSLVADLSERLRAVEHVEGVTSLATVLHVGETPEGDLSIDRFYEGPVADEAAAARIEAAVLSDPLYRDQLVSEDRRTTLLTVQLEPVAPGEEVQRSFLGALAGLFAGVDEDQAPPAAGAAPGRIHEIDLKRGEILDAIDAAVREALAAQGRDPDAWAWGGIGVINEALNEVSQRDLVAFSGLSFVVLVGCLWLTFRRVWAVVLAVAVVELASLTLTGIYLGLGFKFNLVTMILTTLVLVIGITDSIYFICSYQQERPRLEASGLSRREVVVRSLGACFLPGFINSLTTSLAFLAFATADMAVIRLLGIFAGLGILIAFASTVLVCGAGLMLVDVQPPPPGGRLRLTPLLERLLAWLSGLVERRRRPILAASVALFAAAGGGLLLLEVDTYTLGYFYPESRLRRDDDFITSRFGPYMPLELVVEAREPGGVLEPEVLQGVAALERRLVAEEQLVGGSISLARVVERLNEVFQGDPEARRVPDRRDLIEQELLFYDPGREDDPLQLVDFPGYQKARITLRTTSDSARAAGEALGRMRQAAAEELPPSVRLVPSGYVPLYVRLVDYLVRAQVESLALTFGLVLVLMALLFRSVRYALLAVPPNLLPVVGTLGFMGYAGIDLDVATVLIAAVALGIAVDDTIHLLYKVRVLHERSGDRTRAVKKALRTTGVPIVATSLVLTLGFAVLGLASIKSIALFGLLIGVTMISALVGELLVTPAVLLTFGPPHRPGWVGKGL